MIHIFPLAQVLRRIPYLMQTLPLYSGLGLTLRVNPRVAGLVSCLQKSSIGIANESCLKLNNLHNCSGCKTPTQVLQQKLYQAFFPYMLRGVAGIYVFKSAVILCWIHPMCIPTFTLISAVF